MAEGENKEGAVVKVVSSGKLGQQKRSEIRAQLSETDIVRNLRVSEVAASEEHPDMDTVEYYKKLDRVAIEFNGLPEELKNFTEKAKVYFADLAKFEGFVDDADDIEIAVNFVYERHWNQVRTLHPSQTEAGVFGFCDNFTNGVYVRLHSLTSDGILLAACNAVHELRHRVSRTQAVFSGVKEDGEFEEVLVAPAADSIQTTEYSFFEEVYVTGWSIKHLPEILPRELLDLYEAKDERVKKLLWDPVPGAIVNIYKDVSAGYARPYYDFYKIYTLLNSKIPDFDEMMAAVRDGKVGARGMLAREIVKQFGRESLKALTGGTYTNSYEVFSILKANVN